MSLRLNQLALERRERDLEFFGREATIPSVPPYDEPHVLAFVFIMFREGITGLRQGAAAAVRRGDRWRGRGVGMA